MKWDTAQTTHQLTNKQFSFVLGNILVPSHNVQHYQRQSQYTARKYSVVTN